MKASKAKTLNVRATPRTSAHDAIQHSEAAGGYPIYLSGGYYVVGREALGRLEAARASFAHACDHEGRIVLIPVN